MNKIHSRSFDANLVRVFLSIWQTRSLTVSAERLALTQSAVSHALKRLRERFRDPLFVRTPQGMVPTDMAGRLFGPFSEAFHILERVVQEAGALMLPQAAGFSGWPCLMWPNLYSFPRWCGFARSVPRVSGWKSYLWMSKRLLAPSNWARSILLSAIFLLWDLILSAMICFMMI
jgi:hypothetical protein